MTPTDDTQSSISSAEADEKSFLVSTDRIASLCDRNVLAWIILRVLGSLEPNDLSRFFQAAKSRGGFLDVRLVVEGEEFAIDFTDGALREAWDKDVREAVKEWVAAKAFEIETSVKAALESAILEAAKDPESFLA